ncbi:Glycosyltransferase, GT2 family [Ralstonia sp. 25mfcol4.1]|uniref:glycosyltransferase family 2 protein n=1 Tax=Ralstonia sp. 25mfcol4.1 TaxID=1761899 RepID=UPI00040C27CA|nr:glycosyltransferase family 2 protein [Ralstonia sp. 25mfcol4.1]SDP57059.1 Glycosyltransferase, GT2 family [Ralstonia sp. 25mfcol4.1]
MQNQPAIAVVIPSYRVRTHILGLLARIGPECSRIYVVDDCCPDGSGDYVTASNQDPRVVVLKNEVNLGVGGAVMRGYQQAIADGMDIMVKLDGDGQMDPALIPDFVSPIMSGEADYTKGNRFFDLEEIAAMPKVRLFGNAILSFMTKVSSGYWDLFDPTNGYTAIHRDVAQRLPFAKISRRYFFETDMLFRLNTLRAVVVDVPMDAKYGDEVSGLHIRKIVGEFLFKHARNFVKRIFYNYYLRDMSLASIELPLGIAMMLSGMLYGGIHWVGSIQRGTATPAGTVMLAAVLLLIGLQFTLAFIAYDIASVPHRAIQKRARRKPSVRGTVDD